MARLFSVLIGKKVTALRRIAVLNSGDTEQRIDISGALIFRLEPTVLFELIVGQASAQLVPIADEHQILAGFELDQDEFCQQVELEPEAVFHSPPFVVDGVTEWWAGPSDSQFLIGAVLWDANRNPLVSIYTEGDDIDLIAFGKLEALLARMYADYKNINELQY